MTAQQAISRSVSHNEIVTIGPFGAKTFVELRDELRGLSEDYVWTTTSRGNLVEFWGTTDDGDEWRVHLDAGSVGEKDES